MIALSIRQPWASLILKCGKDVENRCWPTKVRGRILIHAAKGMTVGEWEDAIDFAVMAIKHNPRDGAKMTTMRALGFAREDLQRGGIIGSVEIVDCVSRSDSPWFMGEYGFMLRDPRPLPFRPWKGQLGFLALRITVWKGRTCVTVSACGNPRNTTRKSGCACAPCHGR